MSTQHIMRLSSMAVFMLIAIAGCRETAQPPISHVVVVSAASLPTEPSDEAWNAAPEYVAKLILQDLVDPRLVTPSTSELRVRAFSDGSRIAFRLQWSDATTDDLDTPAMFTDACAIQLPAKTEPTIPAPQMGEPGRPVEITYWSAAWQAAVDGRGDSLKDLYPNATVDHYPFEAKALKPGSPEQQAMADRYGPARALGNVMAGPRRKPVQELIATGPGTLSPAPSSSANGRGLRVDDGWAVVISRPLPSGLVQLDSGQIAFAVWEGSHNEAGARKMRTGWITFTEREQP